MPGPLAKLRLRQGDSNPDSFNDPGHRHAAQHLRHPFVYEGSGHDRRSRGPVADFMLLGFGNINHHLGGGMVDIHFVKNSHAIIGDDHFAETIHQHGVQAFGTDRPLYRRSDRAYG